MHKGGIVMAIEMMTDRSVYRYRSADGKPHYRAEIIADTVAELAGVTEQGGIAWDFGSIALTADGKVLMLGSDRVWHDLADGTAITAEVSGNG